MTSGDLSAGKQTAAPLNSSVAKDGPGRFRHWQQHSILLALVALLFGFEILGRLLSAELREVYTAAFSGTVPWAEVFRSVTDALLSPELSFLNPRNLTNLSLQVAITGILAVGMTLVIVTGGIDLSVGSVVALAGVVLGLVDRALGGQWYGIAIVAGIGAGFVAGCLNGVLIARFRITPFVITLGMLVITRGLALIFSNSSAIAPLSDGIRFVGSGFLPASIGTGVYLVAIAVAMVRLGKSRKNITPAATSDAGAALPRFLILAGVGGAAALVFAMDRGIPFPALILALIGLGGAFICQYTVFGRSLYALGGNEPAAILSGINVERVKFWVYAVMGILAGICGLVLAGRLNSATPTEGQLLELDAIASAVIGGSSLQGGIGRVQGSIIGAFIIGALNNGMDMLDISSNWQMVSKGLIIVVAVYSDARVRRES